MKIKNEKHYAILGSDFTVQTLGQLKTYKKGYKTNTWGLYEDGGKYIVEGHGIGHKIPRELFTAFKKTWDEVEEALDNGAKVVKTTHHKIDETSEILAWWSKRDTKKKEKNNACERGSLRVKIAKLRKMIHEVKTGKAEKDLAEMLKKLETLK
jgi:hypothetical protein